MNITYLRYRNSPSDSWITIPSLTSILPSQPSGSLPVTGSRTETSPQYVSPCVCNDDWSSEDHYALRISVQPIPQSAANGILLFLLRYKAAAYHEVKYSGYVAGDFLSAELSHVVAKNENGMSEISFRVAAAIAEVV